LPRFKAEVKNYEEVQKMRYVTSIERLAKEELSREYVITVLQTRFGTAPDSIVELINRIEDLSLLQTLFTNAITIGSLEEFQQLLNESIPEKKL
jgi:coproporphyrinogen III oxidase-like Fe-S oxidoreductase